MAFNRLNVERLIGWMLCTMRAFVYSNQILFYLDCLVQHQLCIAQGACIRRWKLCYLVFSLSATVITNGKATNFGLTLKLFSSVPKSYKFKLQTWPMCPCASSQVFRERLINYLRTGMPSWELFKLGVTQGGRKPLAGTQTVCRIPLKTLLGKYNFSPEASF